MDKQKRLPVPAGPARPAPGLARSAARRRWVALAAGTPRDAPPAPAGPPLPSFGGKISFFNNSPSCSAPSGSAVTQRRRKAHAPEPGLGGARGQG